MAVTSVIPGIGTALIWVPAVIYLFTTGNTAIAIALFLWCALVVGRVDNVLQPRLVGGDSPRYRGRFGLRAKMVL